MMEDMKSTVMEDFCLHINMKISNMKKCFHLRKIGEEKQCFEILRKIGKDMIVLNDLLDKMEDKINQQEKLKDLLQKLQKTAERDQKEAQHLLEHVPPDLPKLTQNCITVPAVPTVKQEEQTKVAEPKPAKKPKNQERVIKEIALIMAEEFEVVPSYLKGRLARDQINAVVKEINKAIVDKYNIMHRPLKSMGFAARNLYDRFMQEETKDTKGEFFIVEADIKTFTQTKLDKRFYSILNILRHCHRVRELRAPKPVRYVIC